MRKEVGTRTHITTAAVLVLAAAGTFAPTANANLLPNGDFELGNTGFCTDYEYRVTNGDFSGCYTIRSNPSGWHYAAASYEDHTPDPGSLMMVLNGSNSPTDRAWCVEVPVAPSAIYEFSFWVSTWSSVPRAGLSVSINGTSNSPLYSFYAPSTVGIWEQHSFTWANHENATTAEISMYSDHNLGDGDFALDDMVFHQVPEPASVLGLVLGICLLRRS